MLPARWVIPLGTGGNARSNIELLYMLRGLQAHHPEAVPVLIGEKPLWYKGEHIPLAEDPTNVKEENIRAKVREACNHYSEFVFANDDHFLLAPFSGRNYCQHSLSYFSSLCFGGIYKLCIDNTIKIAGSDYPYYDVHTPIVINSELFKQHCSEAWTRNRAMVLKTYYAYCCKLVGTAYIDAGLKSPHDLAEIRLLLDGRIMFTINDTVAITKGLMAYMAEVYPVKSRWE